MLNSCKNTLTLNAVNAQVCFLCVSAQAEYAASNAAVGRVRCPVRRMLSRMQSRGAQLDAVLRLQLRSGASATPASSLVHKSCKSPYLLRISCHLQLSNRVVHKDWSHRHCIAHGHLIHMVILLDLGNVWLLAIWCFHWVQAC